MFCNPGFCNRIYVKDLKQNYSKCSWKPQNVCCSLEAVLWYLILVQRAYGTFWITGAGLHLAATLIKRMALFRFGVMSSAVLEQQNCLCREPETEEQEGNSCMLWVNVSLDATSDTGCEVIVSGWSYCGAVPGESWAEGLWKPELTQLLMDIGWRWFHFL